MNRKAWILLFILSLATDISGGLFNNRLVDYIAKPLIVVSVAGYFLAITGKTGSLLKKWILAALFFSWTGDILLMFQEKNSLFFLMGLSAFLIAHIAYIVFFHLTRQREKIKSNVWILLAVVIYYFVFISFLSPYLGDMALPVRVYGIFISFMLMLAMHMLFLVNKPAGRLMAIGAALFILSDSVLAMNKFYHSFRGAGLIIMLTYGFAQFFIVEGAGRYITLSGKE